jgi:DNA-binding MarR family transcriptional regulator
MSREAIIDELWREIRAAQVAVAVRDHAIAERLGVNATDHRCLDLIDQRGPMTAGELAAALRIGRSAVTAVIDRLEARRYVRRAPGRTDRRQVLVELTPLLARRARALYGDGEEGRAFFERYTGDELDLLWDFVRADRELNERWTDELARGKRRLGRGGPSASANGADR